MTLSKIIWPKTCQKGTGLFWQFYLGKRHFHHKEAKDIILAIIAKIGTDWRSTGDLSKLAKRELTQTVVRYADSAMNHAMLGRR